MKITKSAFWGQNSGEHGNGDKPIFHQVGGGGEAGRDPPFPPLQFGRETQHLKINYETVPTDRCY